MDKKLIQHKKALSNIAVKRFNEYISSGMTIDMAVKEIYCRGFNNGYSNGFFDGIKRGLISQKQKYNDNF
jgi:hypothetical protein